VLLRYLVNERDTRYISRIFPLFMIAVKCTACTIDSSRWFERKKRITKVSRRRKIDLESMTHVCTHYFCSCVQSVCDATPLPSC